MPAPVPPTLLSTFEVLFSPQLPPGVPLPAPVAQIGENVIKGYFLSIANPNPRAYTLQVGFHTNTDPAPLPANRTLASAVAFVDDGTPGGSATIFGSAPDFLIDVRIAPRGTILLAVLPVFFSPSGFASTNVDIRGYVDIVLPALFHRPFIYEAQSNVPVSFLFTPEQRLTFLPAAGAASTAVEAQGAFALPIATGGAAMQVPPQPSGFPFLQPFAETVGDSDKVAGRVRNLLTANPAAAFETLASLIAASPAVADGGLNTQAVLKQLGLTEPA